jgi:hypothetical protein
LLPSSLNAQIAPPLHIVSTKIHLKREAVFRAAKR